MNWSTQHRFFHVAYNLTRIALCQFVTRDQCRQVSCFSTSWKSKCTMVVSVGCVRCLKWSVPSQVCGVPLVVVSIRRRNSPTATQLNSVLWSWTVRVQMPGNWYFLCFTLSSGCQSGPSRTKPRKETILDGVIESDLEACHIFEKSVVPAGQRPNFGPLKRKGQRRVGREISQM